MAEVTAALVKELRGRTGAGMMDCKRAMGDTSGDVEAAVDWLRKKGLAAAAKKAGRVAADGLVGAAARGTAGAVVEVNSETDFVARNELFQAFVRAVAALVITGNSDIEALKQMPYPGTGRTVAEELTELVGRIGENLVLRRAARLAVGKGHVASYVHNSLAPGLGKIAFWSRSRRRHRARRSRRSVASSRCMSPPPTRNISTPRRCRAQRSTASALSYASRRRAAARPRQLSSAWSRAGCANSTKRSCSSIRSSSWLARAGCRRSSRRPPKPPVSRSGSPGLSASPWARGSRGRLPILRPKWTLS